MGTPGLDATADRALMQHVAAKTFLIGSQRFLPRP
jgi:hypothetical protein